MKAAFRKYYIVLAAIAVFTVVMVVIVLVQAGATKQDIKTNKAATTIATKLESYITGRQSVPDSLAVLKVAVPKAITYQKLSASSYKFCVDYKTRSSSINVNGALPAVSGGYEPTTDSSYLYISPQHDKGRHCQTIKPYIAPPTPTYTPEKSDREQAIAAAQQTNACSGTVSFATHYSGKVTSVATTDGSAIVPTATQDLIVKIQPNGDTPKGEQTITITKFVNVFNRYCTAIVHGDIRVGDQMAIFTGSGTSFPDAYINFTQYY